MSRVVRRNLSDAVADELTRLIEAGEFRPGDRLPTEAGLMSTFGVGRNTVREAVRSLVTRGVLVVRPGYGTTVLSVSGKDAMDPVTLSALLDDQAVSDLYSFRSLLEVEMAGRAAVRATAADIANIDDCLRVFQEAYRKHLPTWEQDIAFHRAIAEASGNVIYLVVFDAVVDKLIVARKQTDSIHRATAIAARQHHQIANAVRERNVELARKEMAEHIRSAVWALQEARQKLHRATKASTTKDEILEG